MMRRLVPLALALGAMLSVLAVTLSSSTSAFAQVTGPLPNAPTPGTNQTATLLFNAQLAVSQAAQQNAQNAQAAATAYQQAIARYQVGDAIGARTAALQALMTAQRVIPQPIATLAPLAPAAPPAFAPVTGTVAQIDAQAFVAEARGAVSACVNTHDPNTGAATAQLASAERAVKSGKYNDARTAARSAVNLCAAAQRAENAPTSTPNR